MKTPPPTDAENPNREPAATPRWVKVFVAIAVVIVLIFVIILVTRGPGGHGPGRHMPSIEHRP